MLTQQVKGSVSSEELRICFGVKKGLSTAFSGTCLMLSQRQEHFFRSFHLGGNIAKEANSSQRDQLLYLPQMGYRSPVNVTNIVQLWAAVRPGCSVTSRAGHEDKMFLKHGPTHQAPAH